MPATGRDLSVAINVTVVASPRSEPYRADLHIQWQDSNPQDGEWAAYKAVIMATSEKLR